jgi:succinoglycan biosynthesis transport protein ExoP
VAEENKIQPFEPLLASPEPGRFGLRKHYATVEEEEGLDLRAYWRSIHKRRWTIISVLSVVFTLVLIATVKQKPVYRAKAMVEIEQENRNIVTVQELFQVESVSDSYLETQYKILQSDSLARQVIDQLHLDQVKEFIPPKRVRPWGANGDPGASANPASPSDRAREQTVLQMFEEQLGIIPIRHSRLVQVTFDSYDPALAAGVVNAFARCYIEQNLQTHWEATQRATAWLSQQLDGLKIKLEKSEDDLRGYAQSNGLLFLESNQGGTENIVDERLRQLQNELTQAQADRYQKESLYRLVEAGDYGSLPGIFDNKLTQDLTDKLADLERQQAELTPNFNPSYPKMKQIQSQIDRVQQLLKQEREQAAHHLAAEYLAAVRREALVRQAFEEQQRQANLVAGKSVQYNILKREVETNKQLYENLLQRLKEAGVSEGLKASNIRVVDPAVPPTSPVRPRVFLNLGLGLILGLACGVGSAFLQEHLDNTLKTVEDIEHFLRMPALAMIPSRQSLVSSENGNHKSLLEDPSGDGGDGQLAALQKESEKGWFRVDAQLLQHSALSEAFRGLRTSVLLSTASCPPRSLAFVSAEPSEGKTTICSNLAISLAQLGKRVLVIDGDMRRPSIHNFFRIQDSAGLVNYLTGNRAWRDLVQPSGLDRLDCLVCGPVPPNPSELLSSKLMQTLIREAMEEYDFVLVDSPPLLNVADGRILITMVEGAILVVKGGATPRELVQRAQLHVSDVRAHLIGVVLNAVDLRHDGYYYAGYHGYGGYGYGTYGRDEQQDSKA